MCSFHRVSGESWGKLWKSFKMTVNSPDNPLFSINTRFLGDYNGTKAHNHLVRTWTLASLAEWLNVCLQTK